MRLLASLYVALFGPRPGPGRPAAPDQQQPSELTAVSPDFTGFVSNRPSVGPEVVEPGIDDASPPPAVATPRLVGRAPDPQASEFTAVAPEFAGRVSNRPAPASAGSSEQVNRAPKRNED